MLYHFLILEKILNYLNDIVGSLKAVHHCTEILQRLLLKFIKTEIIKRNVRDTRTGDPGNIRHRMSGRAMFSRNI